MSALGPHQGPQSPPLHKSAQLLSKKPGVQVHHPCVFRPNCQLSVMAQKAALASHDDMSHTSEHGVDTKSLAEQVKETGYDPDEFIVPVRLLPNNLKQLLLLVYIIRWTDMVGSCSCRHLALATWHSQSQRTGVRVSYRLFSHWDRHMHWQIYARVASAERAHYLVKYFLTQR